MAEDDLVIELYPYANLIFRKIKECNDCEITDFHSFMTDCAAIITDEIKNAIEDNQGDEGSMPFFELMDIDEFELDVVRVINCHTSEVFCL